MTAILADAGARPLRSPRRRVLAERLAACAAGAALLGLLARLLYAPYQAVYGGTGVDYVAFAGGSRLVAAGDRCLYCLSHQLDAQAVMIGYRPSAGAYPSTFVNAPLAAWLLQPVATLSLSSGLRLFVAGLMVATGISLLLARRSLEALGPRTALLVSLAAIATLPGAMGLVLAQWTPLLLTAMLAALVALRGQRPLLAGLLLSVLFIKPQDGLLLIPALVAARSWRTVLGAALGGVLWWGSGFLLAGWDFPVQFAAQLQHLYPEGVTTAGLPSFAGFTPWGAGLVMPLAVAVSAGSLITIALLRSSLREDPELAVALGITLSLLAAGHVFGEDLLLLVPAILLVARRCSPALALLVVGLLDGAYLFDEHLLHTGPRALEALCTLLVAVLLGLVATREGARSADLLACLDRALATPQRLLAAGEAPDGGGRQPGSTASIAVTRGSASGSVL